MVRCCQALIALTAVLQGSPRYKFTSSVRTSLELPSSSSAAQSSQGPHPTTGLPISTFKPESQLQTVSPGGALPGSRAPPHRPSTMGRPAGSRVVPASVFHQDRAAGETNMDMLPDAATPVIPAEQLPGLSESRPPFHMTFGQSQRNNDGARPDAPEELQPPSHASHAQACATRTPGASSNAEGEEVTGSEGMTVIPLNDHELVSGLSSNQPAMTAISQLTAAVPGAPTVAGANEQPLAGPSVTMSRNRQIGTPGEIANAAADSAHQDSAQLSPAAHSPLSRGRSTAAEGQHSTASRVFPPHTSANEHASNSEGVAGTSEDEVGYPIWP